MTFGPITVEPDHDLEGYGGTWLRRWRVGIRLHSHSVWFTLALSRYREREDAA